MSRYTVVYRDEGTFVDRDARWFKVTVLKDQTSLGLAVGVVESPGWDRELPGGGDGPAVLANAAVRLLAIAVQEAIVEGDFREAWELEAREFPLNARDARHLVNNGVAEPRCYSPDTAVAFFQH
jgi:hypothetical protein